jgi:serine/threonine-protein kinase
MIADNPHRFVADPDTPPEVLDRLERFAAAWQQTSTPAVEDFLPTGPSERRAALMALLGHDLERRLGLVMRVEAYRQRFPELAQETDTVFALAAREFELLRQQPGATLGDYVRRFPQCAAQLQQRFLAEELTAEHTPLAAQVTIPPTDAAAPTIAELPPLRYQPVQFHAQGNLGEVLRAHDAELNREVALKRMQERHAADPASRRRFLREAEVTGRLDHPGVVPVFGLGQDGDGRPCYAMRFIHGEPLQDAIERFHAAEGPRRDPGERRLALRQLLTCFIAVCKTMAYAHSRGILHRDLKPANIMLGKYGETLVVDWGLARACAADEAGGPPRPESLPPPPAGGGSETQMGQMMGTPAYASPEQAAGLWDLVGPRSDIFSLGATLYNLLTNRLPYDASGVLEVIALASTGEVIPPRQRKPDVPRPLEAICLKAMARQAQDRYATALDLAADVEHWLADEPVAAHRAGTGERLARWGRRHRVLTSSAVVAVGVAAVALAVLSGVVGRKNAELAAASEREHEAAALAQRTIEDMTSPETLAFLEKQKELRPEQRRFLAQAVEYYAQAVAAQPADEEGQTRQAGAFLRMGNLQKRLGLEEKAEAAYRAALAHYETLAASQPQAVVYRQDLATSHHNLGALLKDLGRRPQAEAEYRAALEGQAQLVAEEPEIADHRHELAKTRNNLALLLAQLGRRPEALTEYQAAVTENERLAANHPDEPKYRRELAATQNNRGILLAELGRRPQAETALRVALQARARLVAEYPDESEYRNDLGVSHNNLGNVLMGQGKSPDAEAEYGAAVQEQTRLVAKQPQVPSYRQELGQSYSNLGNALTVQGKGPPAEAAYKAALQEQTRLVAEHPQVLLYRQQLGRSHNNLANLLADLGKGPQAEVEYRAALQEQARLAADNPQVPNYRNELAKTHTNLGILLAELGKRPQAEAEYRAALEDRERLAAEHPNVPEYALNLGVGYANFGNFLTAGGQAAQALSWYGKAIALLRDTPDTLAPGSAPVRQSLGTSYEGRAGALTLLERYPEALADWDKAIAVAEDAERYSLRLMRAGTLARSGQVAQAVSAVEQVLDAAKADANRTYLAACVFAIASGHSKDGATAESHAVRAITLLRQAVAKGYKDLKNIQTDNDLNALRQRADFKKLLQEMQDKK